MMALLLAVFLTFSSIAFVSDPGEPRPSPFWWVLVYAADTGIVAVGYALVSTRYVRFWALAIAANLLSIYALAKILPLYATKVPPGTLVSELHQRHVLDAMLVLTVLLLGYVFFFSFVSMEGTKYFRLRAETELARRVQADLVPPLHLTTQGLEICGRSIPSTTVGGDLVDAVVFDGSLTCYLADVSGHGIAASVLMSMVKSAVRTSVSQREPLVLLMQQLNEALFPLKESNAYVTFACLRSADGAVVEYSLAGHPPILHYHSATRDISELKMEQLPISMFRGTVYGSSTVALLPGDLLMIVSDGFLEVANDRGEEFGWGGLESFLLKNGTEPLPRIIEKLAEEAGRFGDRSDDQTILLVKHSEGLPSELRQQT
jgi:sigma-B regulation protein RsbU (phosphoserine phosphatase)